MKVFEQTISQTKQNEFLQTQKIYLYNMKIIIVLTTDSALSKDGTSITLSTLISSIIINEKNEDFYKILVEKIC